MRILALHNRYLVAGGEDQSHAVEMSLLKQQGHLVDEYVVDNEVITKQSLLKIAFNTIWSQESYLKVKKILAGNHYDLVIVQNFFPLLSPSIHYAAKSERVPVIQFLRNYRLFCLNGYALRNNRPCEDCLGRFFPWPGVFHACYRNNRLASMVVACMLFIHRILKTWHRKVDMFVALSEFAKELYQRAGLCSEKIFIKPNSVYPDPGIGEGAGNYVLYIGRLSEEKGIYDLLDAWRILGDTVKLKIAGDGPLQRVVEDEVCSNTAIEYLYRQSRDGVVELMKNAMFLVFPSLWYEGMPRTILEAFAVGTPVLASNIGAAIEMIKPDHTGRFFRTGDSTDLAKQIKVLASDVELQKRMRLHARNEFVNKYALDKNLEYWTQLQELIISSNSPN